MSIFQKMQEYIDDCKSKHAIIIRFEKWMIEHAVLLLIDKRCLDFEAITPVNARVLREYVSNQCPQFEFRWTGVNWSVHVSLAKNGLTHAEQLRNFFLFQD